MKEVHKTLYSALERLPYKEYKDVSRRIRSLTNKLDKNYASLLRGKTCETELLQSINKVLGPYNLVWQPEKTIIINK